MTEQQQSQQHMRPPLRRSKDDRVIAGVCAGVARTLGIDPIVVRVLVAAFSIAGGAGIFAYLIAWILIPDDAGASVIESRREGSRFGQFLIAIILAAVGLAFVSSLNPTGNEAFGFLLFIIIAVVVWQAFGHDWFSRTSVTHQSTPSTTSVTVEKNADGQSVTVTSPMGSTEIRQEPASVLGRVAWNLIIIAVGAMIATNWLGLTEISTRTMLAVVLALTGLALLVSAFVGRARGLIALGIVVALLTVPTSWHGRTDVGERTWAPTAATAIADDGLSYSLGVGDATLDLRGLSPSVGAAPLRVDASLGVGKLTVLLPRSADIHYVVDAEVAMGDITFPDVAKLSGINQTSSIELGPAVAPSIPTLMLDLHTQVGSVEVRYA